MDIFDPLLGRLTRDGMWWGFFPPYCDAHKFAFGAQKNPGHRKQKLARSTSCFRHPGIESKKLSRYLLNLRIRKLNEKESTWIPFEMKCVGKVSMEIFEMHI